MLGIHWLRFVCMYLSSVKSPILGYSPK